MKIDPPKPPPMRQAVKVPVDFSMAGFITFVLCIGMLIGLSIH